MTKMPDLHARWIELQDVVSSGSTAATPSFAPILPMDDGHQELKWSTNDLNNALHTLDWDLEDVEDTIDILFVIVRQWLKV